MERCVQFGPYNTWTDWGLILTAKSDILPPEVKTNYVDLEGMSGSLDLSEALSGEPTYKDRSFTFSFSACEGSFDDRRALIHTITATLHGRKMKIMEPDDPYHYFYGRVVVKSVSHTTPLSEITLECTCEPWRYELDDTVHTINVNSKTSVDVLLCNTGRKTACPEITVAGQVTFTACGVTSQATTGTYHVATFKLYQGENTIQVSGTGTLTLTYRRADL